MSQLTKALSADVRNDAELLGYHENEPVYWLDGSVCFLRQTANTDYVYPAPFTGSILNLNPIHDGLVYFDAMYNSAYCSRKCRDEDAVAPVNTIDIITINSLKDKWFNEREPKCTACSKVLYTK